MIVRLRTASPRRRVLLRAFAYVGLLAPIAAARSVLSSFAGHTESDPAAATAAIEPELAPAAEEQAAADAVEAIDAPTEPPSVRSEPMSEPLALVTPLQPLIPPVVPPPLRPRQSATLPILMYHHVDDLPRTVYDPHRRDLTVSVAGFRRQLEFLENGRVQTVGLGDLAAHFSGRDPLPERAALLTFDDGYEDNYRLAYPLLRQYGMTATFFIVANLVEQPGYVTWEQLREMQRNGMSIESHSLDHVDLAIQPQAELRRQLNESRRLLQLNLLRGVRFLAYPSGKYSPLVVAEARAAGYEAAVTVNYGLQQRSATPFELNRVRVKGADTLESLAAKLVPSHWDYTHGRFGG